MGKAKAKAEEAASSSPRIGFRHLITVLCLCLLSSPRPCSSFSFFNTTRSKQPLPGIRLPDHLDGFNSFSSSSSSPSDPCTHPHHAHVLGEEEDGKVATADDDREEEGSLPPPPPLKLHLKHRSSRDTVPQSKKDSLLESTHLDLSRIRALHTRVAERKNQNALSRRLLSTAHRSLFEEAPFPSSSSSSGLMATLASGVSQGSGEYFMDVFVGNPPRHFSLILDTGSDLNWIQCLPCHDCFEQTGPYYDPSASSSYRNLTCSDPRCALVSSPDPAPKPCRSLDQPCPYFYWYGDRSNTTGDLALETFTVNLTTGGHRVQNVVFGCGHWNRGLFHGAAGLLGLGRGALSFTSQLKSQTFSYCLVDRNSDQSVSSKLILGGDGSKNSSSMNFTALVGGKDAKNAVDTFYYVDIKGVMVGGELLDIPPEAWSLSPDGSGGTIVDSGTTLSYFADPAYRAVKEAFVRKVGKRYPVVEDFPVLDPCYNVSGVGKLELPEFAILFKDGAAWSFPAENYFIRLEPEEVVCLAVLGTPRSTLSILGNYQQQNFHIVYDTKRSLLGFAPADCAQL